MQENYGIFLGEKLYKLAIICYFADSYTL